MTAKCCCSIFSRWYLLFCCTFTYIVLYLCQYFVYSLKSIFQEMQDIYEYNFSFDNDYENLSNRSKLLDRTIITFSSNYGIAYLNYIADILFKNQHISSLIFQNNISIL